jgi:post-segregation antitoxin (ccd killing protein)
MDESLITVRVPKELRERMRRARINWSEELREAIRAKLETNQRRSAEEDLERILASIRPGFDSSQAIKEARRHG